MNVLKPRPWLTSRLLDGAVEERIERALSFQEGDRVPICDIVDNRPAYEHFAPNESNNLAAAVKVYHGLGIDTVRELTNPLRLEQADDELIGRR
ncbi:MAG: hypothetical protein HYY04_07015 [Chloroflexi bacterium]|nr:hypothetical protein [Chloroflexota bacterium]